MENQKGRREEKAFSGSQQRAGKMKFLIAKLEILIRSEKKKQIDHLSYSLESRFSYTGEMISILNQLLSQELDQISLLLVR